MELARMTQKHPITPPPELVQDWAHKAQVLTGDEPVSFAELLRIRQLLEP